MVERVDGLRAGVLGFRLSGKLTRDEYQDELMRPIYSPLEQGEQLNPYFEFSDDFSGLDAGALWEEQGCRRDRSQAPLCLGEDGARNGQGLDPPRRQRIRLAQPR